MRSSLRQINGKDESILFTRMRKIGVLWMTLILLALGWPTLALAGFAGGSGTEEDPYLVATAEHLNTVRDHLDAHFRQTADIALGVAPWNEDEGWEPIGSRSDAFTGSYDGGSHSIDGLFINRPAHSSQGLFGSVREARITNIRLTNMDLTGGSYVGGLAGYMAGGDIEYCHVQGNVAGTAWFIGGIVGSDEGSPGSISHSSMTGHVSSALGHVGGVAGAFRGDLHDVSADVEVQSSGDFAGGLVGGIGGSIRHSFSKGSVTGTDYVGGLVGMIGGDHASIGDCYSLAAVSGGNIVGGLVAQAGASNQWSTPPGNIYRSYSAGPVTGTGDHVGGLLGILLAGSVHLSYWDTETSGQANSAGGDGVKGLTTSEMMQQRSFWSYNFYTLWSIEEGRNYPVFQDLTVYSKQKDVNLSQLAGRGTDSNPYIITTADELAAIAHDLEASYKLGNDIDLKDSIIWHNGKGWSPLGPFTGNLDGNGRTIANLTISNHQDYELGLFKQAYGGIFQDIHLGDVHVYGFNNLSRVGALFGSLGQYQGDDTVIENCSVSGIIAGKNIVGGISGSASNAKFNNILTAVDVYGDNSGGLIGHGANLELTAVLSIGSVHGGTRVGGLIGFLQEGKIENSYSRSMVQGKSLVGGLAGDAGDWMWSPHYHYWQASINGSYSTGQVLSDGDDVGGILGRARYTDHWTGYMASVWNSYWDVETSGQDESSNGNGNAAGRNTLQMTYPYDENTYNGWDFVDVWAVDIDPSRNDGYPYLRDVTREAVTIQVQADPDDRGQVSGSGTYLYGTTMVARAAPEDGYAFINWTEGGQIVSTSPSYTFSATANRTLVAHFGEARGSLRVVINPDAVRNQARWRRADGSWRASGDTETNVPSGEHVVAFNIVPGWNTLGNQNVEISVNETTILHVAYTQNNTEYPIQVNADGPGGSVTGGHNYPHNSLARLIATPKKGYRFLHWKDDLGRIYTDRIMEFRATELRTFTAHFEELKVALPGVLMLLLDEE